MANEKHLAILKQGPEEWNAWRKANENIHPELNEADLKDVWLGALVGRSGFYSQEDLYDELRELGRSGELAKEIANLSDADLRDVDLSGSDLVCTSFRRADLTGARLTDAELAAADLSSANLSDSRLRGAHIFDVRLEDADLKNADLQSAIVRGSTLAGADLRGANLSYTTLIDVNLSGAILDNARLMYTVFAGTNLSDARGLHTCHFDAPCNIDHATLELSKGAPEGFLLGCGLSDWQIEAAKLYRRDLTPIQITDIIYEVSRLRSERPIQIAKLFISYSHADAEFIDNIEKHLKDRGVRYWRDIHDAPAGALESIVLRAMRGAIVLLVLSKNSAESDWVEFEAEQARRLEKESSCHVLCPIALDDTWLHCNWSAVLRTQIKKYNVLDFSNWRDGKALNNQVERLLSGIKLYY